MSAWLIFATLGFYPVTAGQGNYMTGLPLVKKARIQLATGTLTILAKTPVTFKRQLAHQVALKMDGNLVETQKPLAHEALLKARTLDFSVEQLG
jgi:putative alpha-1,2-mannosidase